MVAILTRMFDHRGCLCFYFQDMQTLVQPWGVFSQDLDNGGAAATDWAGQKVIPGSQKIL